MTRVSIVVPNFNGGELFRRCVNSLIALDFPPEKLQIILVDDASTDGGQQWLTRLDLPSHFHLVLHQQNQGRSMARNSGLRLVDGDVIILMDGDLTADAQLVLGHLQALQDPQVVAVAGSIQPAAEVKRTRMLRYMYDFGGRGARQFPESKPISFQFLLTGNMSFPHHILETAGLFDESFSGYGGEDTLFALKIWSRHPHGLRFSQKPVVFDHDEYDLDTVIAKFASYGRHNLIRLVEAFPQVAPQLHADWVLGSRWKTAAGRTVFHPLLHAAVRILMKGTPYPLSNYAIRYLLGSAVVQGLHSCVSQDRAA